MNEICHTFVSVNHFVQYNLTDDIFYIYRNKKRSVKAIRNFFLTLFKQFSHLNNSQILCSKFRFESKSCDILVFFALQIFMVQAMSQIEKYSTTYYKKTKKYFSKMLIKVMINLKLYRIYYLLVHLFETIVDFQSNNPYYL